MSARDGIPDTVESPSKIAVAEEEKAVVPAGNANNDGPPNGGLVAWLQVAGCFALYLNTLGIVNTYGVFQSYYEVDLLQTSSPSAISWIGSVQAFFLLAIGVFVGPLYDAGHFRTLLFVGTFLITFGFMMTSISTTYWQIFLSQGLCIGLGTSCLAVPSIAVVPTYFTPPKRAWAMGMATLGSGLGATIYPIVFQAAQPRIGFPWTVRMLGFISFSLCLFSIAVVRPRFKRLEKGQGVSKWHTIRDILRRAKLTDKRYMVYVAGIFFNNVGYFEPLFYLQSYALAYGMAGRPVTSYLLSILNASGIPGRLLPPALASRFGTINTFISICFMCAVAQFYWISATNEAGIIAMAVLYGIFCGGVMAFAPVVLTSITEDLSTLGTRIGVLSVLKGLGSLAGPPIAGALLKTSGGYLALQLFTGFSFVLSASFMIVLRAMSSKGKAVT